MSYQIKRSLKSLEKREERMIAQGETISPLKEKIYAKVPQKLRDTLEAAFEKAFHFVFLNGTSFIEKTFDKEDKKLEFSANDSRFSRKGTRQNMKRLDKSAQKSKILGSLFTTASGLGLGVLGIGIPDVPIFVGTILNGLYQTALSYGFHYESKNERIYMLRLIRTALADDEHKKCCNALLDSEDYLNTTLNEEILATAKTLSDALLVEKFIQGIPILGAVGGIVNNRVNRKIQKFATIKYKKRYLASKIE